ncbi:syntaxin, putative [Trypanosoma equiperdum]|uniref:Syntaxin, putative n=2 Tax=Trypanozoon TaxID=39700 RepID=Q38FF1_TRYB2|nr:syntaxin, putative [Trypanosoma brucei brucei TREU927]EAN76469.1 syntaxin, putative [Trypanosoma brucei brucei TREU927]SCU68965.1 syntaxin, putative [Trypanosoma equiperdum]
MSDVKGALTRLERLHEACGGAGLSTVGALPADGGANMSVNEVGSYEKGQYHVACLMKRARESMTILAETGESMDIARRAEISNSIRRDMSAVKKECTALNRVAMKEGKRGDYMQLLSFVNKTEQFQRRLHNGPVLGEASGAIGDGSTHVGGTTPGVPEANAVTADSENREVGSFISASEVEGFLQFFEETRKRDAEIDQVLERISAGVTRLQENALTLRSELCTQQRLLDDTEEKVDGIHAKLDSLNIKLRRTLEQVDKDRMSVYILCCLLLLGIYGAIYNMSR